MLSSLCWTSGLLGQSLGSCLWIHTLRLTALKLQPAHLLSELPLPFRPAAIANMSAKPLSSVSGPVVSLSAQHHGKPCYCHFFPLLPFLPPAPGEGVGRGLQRYPHTRLPSQILGANIESSQVKGKDWMINASGSLIQGHAQWWLIYKLWESLNTIISSCIFSPSLIRC